MGCVKSKGADTDDYSVKKASGSTARGNDKPMKGTAASGPVVTGGPLSQKEYNTRIASSKGVQKIEIPATGVQLEYAYVSQRGYYPEALDKANQDAFCVHPKFGNDPNQHFFGIFDGHGEFGTPCSEFARDKVPHNILKDPNFKTDISKTYNKAFVDTNTMLHRHQINDEMSGTTAITVIMKHDKLYVANVGDSRACAAERVGGPGHTKLVAVDLSVDQTPFRDDECARVERCGARVLTLDQLEGLKDQNEKCWGDEEDDDGDPPRLWAQNGSYPGTAFTRSIGDSAAEKIGVFAEPEILIKDLSPEVAYVVIASDGVFEFISSQTVIDMVTKFENVQEACNAIVSESYRLWLQYETRTDDITIIVIKVNHPKSSVGTSSSFSAKAPAAHDNRPVRRGLSKQKRQAIQQNMDDEDDDEPYAPPKNLPKKTPAEIANIDAAVKANFLFSHLSDAKRKTIYEVMEKKVTKPGEVIIKQGDKGDHFYVIEHGEFDVYVARPGENSLGDLVHTYVGTGNTHPSFGELALMYGKPRAATVKSKTAGMLWQLDRRAFKGILHKKDNKSIIKVLRSVEVLQSLNIGQLQRLADILSAETFEDCEYIIKQGDVGNEFYIIDKGSVVCTVKKNVDNPNEVAKEVLKLGPGQYFGERALLGNAKRAANVIAKGRVRCLHIGRQAFEEVLGPLQHIINQDRKWRERAAEQKEAVMKRPSLMVTAAVTKPSELQLLEVIYCTDVCMVASVAIAGKQSISTLKVYPLSKVAEMKREAAVMKEHSIVQSMSPIASIPVTVKTLTDDKSVGFVLHCTPVCTLENLMMDVLSEKAAAFYAAETILTLEHLHNENIVYRSLQPDTILVDEDGHLMFVDFQFSKALDGPTYTLCGNPEFLAPEMVENVGHTPAVDFWALGVFIFFLLTGETPFADDDSELKIYSKITERKLTWPSDISATAKDLIDKLLTKDPNMRLGYGSGGVDALKKHPWFSDINWEALASMMRDTVSVPAEIVKRVKDVDPPEVKALEMDPYSGDREWFKNF